MSCVGVTRLLLLLPAALAACGAAADDPPSARPAAPDPGPRGVRPGPEPTDCPLSVRFGSYAMGIDRPTLAAVEALLDADPAVASVDRQSWGREGEITLCARLRDDEAADPLARRIAALLPADPRGPVRVATRTGLVFDAPARR